MITLTPEIVSSKAKSDLDASLKFAKAYSKTFKTTRVIVENLNDANGITIWKNNNRQHDNNEVILFINGVRKKA